MFHLRMPTTAFFNGNDMNDILLVATYRYLCLLPIPNTTLVNGYFNNVLVMVLFAVLLYPICTDNSFPLFESLALINGDKTKCYLSRF